MLNFINNKYFIASSFILSQEKVHKIGKEFSVVETRLFRSFKYFLGEKISLSSFDILLLFIHQFCLVYVIKYSTRLLPFLSKTSVFEVLV